MGRAVVNKVHGFSLAESLQGKKRHLSFSCGLCYHHRAWELPLLVSWLCLIEVSVYNFFLWWIWFVSSEVMIMLLNDLEASGNIYLPIGRCSLSLSPLGIHLAYQVYIPSNGWEFYVHLVFLYVFQIILCTISYYLWVQEWVCLHQRSPTFLAPGTVFVEDNFSTGGGGDGSGGNVSHGERQMKLRSPPAVWPGS